MSNNGKSINRLLPKCNDRNKKLKQPFHSKIDQFHPKTGQFWHSLKLKMLEISQIPLGSIRLMVKQALPCFTFVSNSTVNTGFWQFCWFFGFIIVKIPPKFFKKLQNDLWHAKLNV